MNDWGSLRFAFMGTLLDEYLVTAAAGRVRVRLRGPVRTLCAHRCRRSARACGRPGRRVDVDVSLNWRYFDSVDIESSSSDADLNDRP